MIYHVSHKLDYPTLVEWEREADKLADYPTYDNFLKFLESSQDSRGSSDIVRRSGGDVKGWAQAFRFKYCWEYTYYIVQCSVSVRKEPERSQVPLRECETALRFRAKRTSAGVHVPLQYRQRATHTCTPPHSMYVRESRGMRKQWAMLPRATIYCLQPGPRMVIL